MSERFPGGIISKTAPVPTGPYETGTAPGIWTLDQQAEFVKQGIWPIAGLTPNYIEDVFSTWLYTGNGSTQTITNGIDLAGEGGLVWFKRRDATGNHNLFDTARGATKKLYSDLTNAEYTDVNSLTSFNANGFSIGVDLSGDTRTYASWTFRKQPKFFDVVAGLTADGSGNMPAFNHSLDSVPGCVFLKATNSGSNWVVYHRGLSGSGANQYIQLNTTNAATNATGFAVATSTTFQVAAGSALVPDATYVAYLFAHDAGGFGESGEDNVISCGSYTGNGDTNGLDVNLGYEPQWVLVKESSSSGNYWLVADNMRGMTADMTSAILYPNDSAAEISLTRIGATATGFKVWGGSGSVNNNGSTYIYIAIRRGPMKVPESGTEVFQPTLGDGTAPAYKTPNFTPNLAWTFYKPGYDDGTQSYPLFFSRLTGNAALQSANTRAELTSGVYSGSDYWTYMNGFLTAGYNSNWGAWMFQRAPGFCDVVCYTGNGVNGRAVNHNLSVVPELMIFKSRSNTASWIVYASALGATRGLELQTTGSAFTSANPFNNTEPTATTFTLGVSSDTNYSAGYTYVAYLFASCPGVSKVGSYTGTAATLQIDCGFTTGARFVLIKRTDSTGDWYVWDSARGIVAGDDPYLLLNSTAAEVTNTDYVDTYSAGFEITSTAPAAINASGGSFIFLAIA